MGMWLWVIAVLVPTVLAATWVDHHRGSRGAYRSADLPALKRGRPRPVDFDHTVGPCLYDVGPEARPELTGLPSGPRLGGARRRFSRPV